MKRFANRLTTYFNHSDADHIVFMGLLRPRFKNIFKISFLFKMIITSIDFNNKKVTSNLIMVLNDWVTNDVKLIKTDISVWRSTNCLVILVDGMWKVKPKYINFNQFTSLVIQTFTAMLKLLVILFTIFSIKMYWWNWISLYLTKEVY